MKVRIGLAAVVVAALASCSSTEKATWEGGAKFEKGTPVAIAELNKNAATMSGKQVQIEGTVSKVCQGSGCWVEVSDGTVSVIAKSLDEKVLFPKDCVGKKVLVQGIYRAAPESS